MSVLAQCLQEGMTALPAIFSLALGHRFRLLCRSVTDPLDDLGLGHFADSLMDVKPGSASYAAQLRISPSSHMNQMHRIG